MVDATTPAEIARLKELLGRAMAGDWLHVPISRDGEVIEDRIVVRHSRGPATIVVQDVSGADDAALIVALRNAAPSLLATIAAQSAEIERLREVQRESEERVAEVERRAVAHCIEIVRQARDGFLSSEYATDQPVSSLAERFACDQCINAIEHEWGLISKKPSPITKAVRFTAYNRSDPLAVRLEFMTDSDRLEAAEAIDEILSEAFAAATVRMKAVLAERAKGRAPIKVRNARTTLKETRP